MSDVRGYSVGEMKLAPNSQTYSPNRKKIDDDVNSQETIIFSRNII